jgi:hypothetical protein
MVLEKAKLIPCTIDPAPKLSGQGSNSSTSRRNTNKQAIEFMFNPTELNFSRSMNIEQSEGSRTDQGSNKTSFKHPSPYQLTISNIILDTYEGNQKQSGQPSSVLDQLKPFTDAVVYVQTGAGQAGAGKSGGTTGENKRPPIYLFTWGEYNYLRCFVRTLNFRLTMFLPDGTPVRAIVDLTLEQVDEKTPKPDQSTPRVSPSLRQQNSRPGFNSRPIL